MSQLTCFLVSDFKASHLTDVPTWGGQREPAVSITVRV